MSNPRPPCTTARPHCCAMFRTSVKAADVKSRFHIWIIKVAQSSKWLLRFTVCPSKATDQRENFSTIDSHFSPLKPLKVGTKNEELPISIFNWWWILPLIHTHLPTDVRTYTHSPTLVLFDIKHVRRLRALLCALPQFGRRSVMMAP